MEQLPLPSHRAEDVAEKKTPHRDGAVAGVGDPVATYLGSLASPASRREMAACLNRIVRLSTGDDNATAAGQPWHKLTYRDTARLKETLCQQGWSAAHVNKHLVALRRVLTEAWRLGLMDAEQKDRACDIADVTSVRLPRGHHVAAEVIGAVLAACDADEAAAGRRDAAIIAVLYSTGCRRAEIAGLRLRDYDPAERGITVIGKGDKQRLVHLNAQAVAKVEAWLAVRGRGDGAMFSPISAAGRIRMRDGVPAGMSGQAIGHMLTRRLRQAGAPQASPHDLRRTFIGSLLDAGVDLATTQAIVGHASPATTARYDRRPDHRRREAIDRLELPQAKPLR
ncbi:tyrosine-type recombinase/integrase [Stackebrandtia nassauensis]|uniref:Integrase family protein n=1 Tax=Stackebrandtia nassauensis (strain DSM 44728 / CIP 108903 / NRRL B-16338 / NBRC 102104 / LLR-40K-21) TaxID=446470 RepID=D3QBK9_STANL|nr:tyrosine-type recombinase/integrase [Stackebrandtia nassauensis]ADD42891.1 integrase family protein [Stackebrandtia nassauensis DSM 44728]